LNESRVEKHSGGYSLDPKMRLGAPNVRVRDLEGTVRYYKEYLFLTPKQDKSGKSSLVAGSSDPLVILENDPNASEPPPGSAGLYHFAILVPDRKSLAMTYLALRKSGVYFEGYADHLVSESLYLRDPEGNGIEIYRDRAREEWKFDGSGKVKMDTLPLNISSLLSELTDEEREEPLAFPRGARIGHMHLKVTNSDASRKFYSEKLGLDITSDWSRFGALFLSVGGYHHHIGLNIWESKGGPQVENGNAGLDHFTILISKESLRELAANLNLVEKDPLLFSDPDGIRIEARSEY
jgi:catechol 2,3-dioxygenase